MRNGPRIPGARGPSGYNSKKDSLSKVDVLYQMFGDLVNEVKHAFLTLDEDTFARLIHDYRSVYGDKAAEYAIQTYPLWKNHRVRLSGQTMERLLQQVPPYLSEDVRYSVLVKLLRQGNPAVATSKLVLNLVSEASALNELEKAYRYTNAETAMEDLPERIHDAALWLNAKNPVQANEILIKADMEVHGVQRRAAKRVLDDIAMAIKSKKLTKPHYSIAVPGRILTIIVQREQIRVPITAAKVSTTSQSLPHQGLVYGCFFLLFAAPWAIHVFLFDTTELSRRIVTFVMLVSFGTAWVCSEPLTAFIPKLTKMRMHWNTAFLVTAFFVFAWLTVVLKFTMLFLVK